ncbi:hypothetical protein RRG08_047389 [Elysia crispata]|uniref:Uncharacterized protein n=1 Tax=Elysia crispata TaxID=231223 RepID=A0AAE1CRZ0_9GAST|nr:hypothetical protein RRG08_047389 [Elysia crispata]
MRYDIIIEERNISPDEPTLIFCTPHYPLHFSPLPPQPSPFLSNGHMPNFLPSTISYHHVFLPLSSPNAPASAGLHLAVALPPPDTATDNPLLCVGGRVTRTQSWHFFHRTCFLPRKSYAKAILTLLSLEQLLTREELQEKSHGTTVIGPVPQQFLTREELQEKSHGILSSDLFLNREGLQEGCPNTPSLKLFLTREELQEHSHGTHVIEAVPYLRRVTRKESSHSGHLTCSLQEKNNKEKESCHSCHGTVSYQRRVTRTQ